MNKKINIDNNTKKTPEKTLEILDFDEVLDISLDADVNTIINPDSSGTFSSSKENLSASDIKQETNNICSQDKNPSAGLS